MNWLFRWLQKKLHNSQSLGTLGSPTLHPEESNSSRLDYDNPLTLRVFTASGGLVIESTKYNRQKGNMNKNLYAITHDISLSKELEKIITIEALRS